MLGRHIEPLEVFIPGVDALGPVYHMADRQLHHRPFYRRPDMITLAVALGPMFLLYDDLAIFPMVMLVLPLALWAVTFLWSFFGARKLLLSGTLFHMTLTPLPLSQVLKDYEKHFRVTGMQSMTLLIWAFTLYAGMAIWFEINWGGLLPLISMFFYMFIMRQILMPVAASAGFRWALTGRFSISKGMADSLFLLVPPIGLLAYMDVNSFIMQYGRAGLTSSQLVWMGFSIYLPGFSCLVACFYLTTVFVNYLRRESAKESKTDSFENKVMQRISGLSYS